MARMQWEHARSAPRLDDDLRRRIREAVRRETHPRKHNALRSSMASAGEDGIWEMAWAQRHLSDRTFNPAMRAVVRLAREVARGLEYAR